ncbi:hypothetical protein HJC23_012713 [Cyclotella cryptica]|uniref:Methyltransferase domain-containing protein n=1 Tax=Cyclotella cryptica TaxID=29204 RepID=A0ABD3PLP0_9STRA|eukprot:CCRYP_013344-RA/>CCRYP_013344-RA protein AED:0.00 eAED:0.00 QI:90/-1/1/1/-1/1/1/60/541
MLPQWTMESISKSGKMTEERPIIHGVITRRRSIGRNLAFADVAIAESPNHDNSIDVSTSIRVMFNRQSFVGPTSTADMLKTDNIDVGHLGSCTQLDESFPTKRSSLPYGAKIMIMLGRCIKKSIDDEDHSRDVCTWEAVRWKIVDHPKELAVRLASLSMDSASAKEGLAKQSHHNQYDNQHDIIVGHGALSCSTYLKIRRGQFDIVHSSRNSSSRNNADLRNKAGLKATLEQTTKEAEEKSLFAAQFFHGDKYAKGKRAKIFAAWVLETFFGMNSIGEKIYCEPCAPDRFELDAQQCHEPSLHDGSSFIQNIHVLDIAGGKGHLSLELVLQQLYCGLSGNAVNPTSRISKCTVVDPLVRKGDAKMRHSRLKKRRIPHSKSPADNTDKSNEGTEVPTITHLATAFTADSFPCINENFINSFDNETSSSEGSLPSKLLLLGLHPDQCTEDIVDVALHHNLPFAIVPCCVFPDQSPSRKHWKAVDDYNLDGREEDVKLYSPRTYSDFVEYLRQKDERIRMTELPFKGKNIVLYKDVDRLPTVNV